MAKIERDGGDCSAVAQADGDPGYPEVGERALVPLGGMNGRLRARLQDEMIPEHTIDALIDYVEHGRAVGSFLSAVLVGDLFGTFRSADHRNRRCVDGIVRWLWSVPPGLCYGSEDKVAAWAAMAPMKRGLTLRECPTWRDFMRQWEAGDFVDGVRAVRP